MTFRMNGLA